MGFGMSSVTLPTREKQGTAFVPECDLSVAATLLPLQIQRDATYSMADVARIVFHRTVKWFYQHHDRLRREDGFPQPISPIGQPRWSGAKLLAWCNRDHTQRPVSAGPPAPGLADLNVINLEDELRARGRDLARPRRRRR